MMELRTGARRRVISGPDELDLPSLVRCIWSEAPLLAVIDLLITLGVTATILTALTVVALAPLVAALLLGPIWIGAVASCERIHAGDAPGVRELFGQIRRHGRDGAALAIVPGAVTALLLGSLEMLTMKDGERWMLAPIALDAAVLIVLGFGCLAVFSLAIGTPLRGRACWFAAIAWAGRNLTKSAGVAAIVILLALSVQFAGPFPGLAMAGPLSLLITALTGPSTRKPVGP